MTNVRKFWKNVNIVPDPPDLAEDDIGPCWEWKPGKARDRDGYGLFRHRNVTYRAHRVAFAIEHGYMPDGVVMLHACDNPPCCRPSHLADNTHLANMEDMKKKGRQAKGDRVVTAKLNWTIVRQLRDDAATGDYSMPALAAKYNVHLTTAIRIVKGETWHDDVPDAPGATGDHLGSPEEAR